MSTILERDVRRAWLQAPYQRSGRCATCGCTRDEDDRPLWLAGVNGDSMVCLPYFGDEHDGRFPNYRRQIRRTAG